MENYYFVVPNFFSLKETEKIDQYVFHVTSYLWLYTCTKSLQENINNYVIFIRYVAVDNGLNITENYNLFFLNTSWRARRCRWKNKFRKINRLFLAYNTPGHLRVSTKKIQPIRSSRLAGQREHIYKCLVLFYIEDWYLLIK